MFGKQYFVITVLIYQHPNKTHTNAFDQLSCVLSYHGYSLSWALKSSSFFFCSNQFSSTTTHNALDASLVSSLPSKRRLVQVLSVKLFWRYFSQKYSRRSWFSAVSALTLSAAACALGESLFLLFLCFSLLYNCLQFVLYTGKETSPYYNNCTSPA